VTASASPRRAKIFERQNDLCHRRWAPFSNNLVRLAAGVVQAERELIGAGMRSRMEVREYPSYQSCGRPEHIASFCEIADQLEARLSVADVRGIDGQ